MQLAGASSRGSDKVREVKNETSLPFCTLLLFLSLPPALQPAYLAHVTASSGAVVLRGKAEVHCNNSVCWAIFWALDTHFSLQCHAMKTDLSIA